jgi:hypothetical protein
MHTTNKATIFIELFFIIVRATCSLNRFMALVFRLYLKTTSFQLSPLCKQQAA